MHRSISTCATWLSAALCSAIAFGQSPAERRSSSSESRSSWSSGGETKSHRRSVRDGVVVEEEGTPFPELERWLEDARSGAGVDADALLEKLRREMGAPALGDERNTKSSSHSRRVVVIDGKTVVDEELRDGKPVRREGSGGDDLVPPGAPGRSEARADARCEASARAESSGSSSHEETSSKSSESSESGKSGKAAKDASTSKEERAEKRGASKPSDRAAKPLDISRADRVDVLEPLPRDEKAPTRPVAPPSRTRRLRDA